MATAAAIELSGVCAGSATEAAWRWRSAASTSTGAPGTAAAALLTDCQPFVGVRIWVSVFAPAATAPSVSHVAVTLMVPEFGIVTLAGRSQRVPRPMLSPTTPPVMVVFACPTIVTTAVEALGESFFMPLSLTADASAVPCAVAGENAP